MATNWSETWCSNCQRLITMNFTAKEAKQELKGEGWKFSKGKTLCPDCQPQTAPRKGKVTI